MTSGRILTADEEIRSVLSTAKSIAVLGLSPKPDRDSFQVAAYLQQHGYRIIPVRPAQAEILGEKAYASLDTVPETVDIIDVFRSPDQVLPHAREALRLKPKVFWMQEGIENHEAAALLNAAAIHVVMNRCIKREHVRLGL
ncbi:MAG: CoA-binding protein [Desulfobacterales bacterium]|jgi:predicted CoA-binding protein|nr:CoA-binding protein [Desulfobacterales bacterium]